MDNKIIKQKKESIIQAMHITSDFFDKMNKSDKYDIVQIVYIGNVVGDYNLFVEYIIKK